MAFKLLDETEHRVLIEKLQEAPVADRRKHIYEKSLSELFEKYKKELMVLEQTMKDYREVALMAGKNKRVGRALNYVAVRKPGRLKERVM